MCEIYKALSWTDVEKPSDEGFSDKISFLNVHGGCVMRTIYKNGDSMERQYVFLPGNHFDVNENGLKQIPQKTSNKME